MQLGTTMFFADRIDLDVGGPRTDTSILDVERPATIRPRESHPSRRQADCSSHASDSMAFVPVTIDPRPHCGGFPLGGGDPAATRPRRPAPREMKRRRLRGSPAPVRRWRRSSLELFGPPATTPPSNFVHSYLDRRRRNPPCDHEGGRLRMGGSKARARGHNVVCARSRRHGVARGDSSGRARSRYKHRNPPAVPHLVPEFVWPRATFR